MQPGKESADSFFFCTLWKELCILLQIDATAWTLPSARLSKDLIQATKYFLGEKELPYSFESVGVILHTEKCRKATIYSNPIEELNL